MNRTKVREMLWNLPYGDAVYSIAGGFIARNRKFSTGGSCDAKYCYSVWLKHLIKSYESGLDRIPFTIAELGPGDSLGTGLAAMLCGVRRYYALDVVYYQNLEKNIPILEELVELFTNRTPLPEYPFPRHILTDEVLGYSLSLSRINEIKEMLRAGKKKYGELKIDYLVPYDKLEIDVEPVELVFSHAVLEHVDNLRNCYAIMGKILSAGGYMSHQIDFSSHGTSKYWNGHWGYSDMVWKLIYGSSPFLLNRCTVSQHIELMRENGMEILRLEKCDNPGNEPAMSYDKLAKSYKKMGREDFETAGAYILARKGNSMTG